MFSGEHFAGGKLNILVTSDAIVVTAFEDARYAMTFSFFLFSYVKAENRGPDALRKTASFCPGMTGAQVGQSDSMS